LYLMIKGKKWKVKYLKRMKVDGHDTDGYCDPKRRVIAIRDKAVNSNDYYRILMHEVLHAIWHESGLDNTNIGIDMEEVIVENFATALNEIFKVSIREAKRPDIKIVRGQARSGRDR